MGRAPKLSHDQPATERLRRRLRAKLLEAFDTDAGHWFGRLSSSALSTATACLALCLWRDQSTGARRDEAAQLVKRGVSWLIQEQNEDGAWGDTTRSLSNISTTALVWGALAMAPEQQDRDQAWAQAKERVEAWLRERVGSLEPKALQRAIIARYGRDKTFSVPILMVLALSGRLGENGWRLVPQLPFPLAACPRSWFHKLSLPVVSYAIPALIAIGHVKHVKDPGWNPFGRVLRSLTKERTLRVLLSVQPINGGFLEATPLTSFVSMSLLAAGYISHPVASEVLERGTQFLKDSQRSDGAWPIDTNLATWVSTLSINALGAGGGLPKEFSEEARLAVLTWLKNQQYKERHPYTDSPPGGWAWTDLPGGVPDADDSSGALLALRSLAQGPQGLSAELIDAGANGVRWLMGLQNRDGGVATFCRGWGTLPFDRSSPDISAHALTAWQHWRQDLPESMQPEVTAAMRRAVGFLKKVQGADGRWYPLWFGNEFVKDEGNPVYGTSRVMLAFQALSEDEFEVSESLARAREYLRNAQNEDGSWGGDVGVSGTIEETALALHALSKVAGTELREVLERGALALDRLTRGGTECSATAIGFYFAKLWYFEDLYPLIFAVGALEAFHASYPDALDHA